MMHDDFAAKANQHKQTAEQLYFLSPEIEEQQAKIGRFLLAHPSVIGITYHSAELLMNEKDPLILSEAITWVSEEIAARKDTNNPNYCLKRRNVSKNQVQCFLRNLKLEKAHKNVIDKSPGENSRSKVMSFRTTKNKEDAIDFLAAECGISKSLLIEILIKLSNRYGIELESELQRYL